MRKRETELHNILNDNIHGSSELYNLLLNHFEKYCDDLNYISIASKGVKKYLIHFPIIINFIKEIEIVLKNKNPKALKLHLQTLYVKKDKTYADIFRKAEKSIREINSVITISHSKTLIEIFKLWKKLNPKIEVIVCESRPRNEGILMAEELVKSKIKTKIITEAMAGKIIKDTDAIILGADQLLSNGNIVNKTGSRILAIAAKYENIPVYVFSTSDKKVPKRILKKSMTAKAKITKQNLNYMRDDFEVVENKLITKIFSD